MPKTPGRRPGGIRPILSALPRSRRSLKLAVLSDVHANREALEAALRLAEAHRADALYCLGDVVGYGPEPGPCVDLVRAHCEATVLGNHDEAVALGVGLDALPRDGEAAARLHASMLSEDQLAWLSALPLLHVAHGCTFVHASPEDPGAWVRLEGYHTLHAQFAAFDTPVCFVGHSHVPAVVADRIGVLRVRAGHRYLINAGSVGQPRDGDPRLALAVFDTEAFTCGVVRAHYAVERTAAKIVEAGLPPALAARLRHGA